MTKHRITHRLVAKGNWISQTALHCGGDPNGSTVDMALLRDEHGQFLIPAASIAGAARHHLARLLSESYEAWRTPVNDDRPKEGDLTRAVFGKEYASLLTVADARLENSKRPAVRDGVRIRPDRGTAFEGARFDYEVIPAGAVFPFEFVLNLYDEPPLVSSNGEIRNAFYAILQAFRSGDIRLGAKTRSGLGAGRVTDWHVFELEFAKRKHVLAWLKRTPEDAQRITDWKTSIQSRETPFEMELDLRLHTSILIRRAGLTLQQPDVVHLADEKESLIAGTSFRGVLRHRCARIARRFVPDEIRRVGILASMFGSQHKEPAAAEPAKENLRGGRLWLTESAIRGGERHIQSRVAIDRATGAAKDSALFDAAPHFGNQAYATLKLRLDAPRDLEIGLLLAALRDLWTGQLTLGGEYGGGRGAFAGLKATLRHGSRHWTITQTPSGLRIEGDDPNLLNAYLTKAAAEAWTPPQWDLFQPKLPRREGRTA